MKFFLMLSLIATASQPARAQISDDEWSSWREQIRTWAPVCDGAVAKADCEDGDSTLWNGLLCFSGEAWACDAVRNMQSADGRVWRSPRRVGAEDGNTFSRDMSFGALLYIAATGDASFGQRWSSYIQATGALCPDAGKRCNVSTKVRDTFNRVADAYSFEKLPLSIILGDSSQSAGDFDVWLAAQTESTGYTLHLVAMHILVRRQFGQSYFLNAAIETLVRRQPDNPFFQWLVTGDSETVRNLMASQIQVQTQGNQRQWSFERDTAEQAWLDSMGWEFIFMINLLLR